VVLTLEGDAIAAITWFADSGVFGHFGLPRMQPNLEACRCRVTADPRGFHLAPVIGPAPALGEALGVHLGNLRTRRPHLERLEPGRSASLLLSHQSRASLVSSETVAEDDEQARAGTRSASASVLQMWTSSAGVVEKQNGRRPLRLVLEARASL
jgi:hypothetical protein